MTSPAATARSSSTRSFAFSRLGSLFGMLPLGVWTVNHLFDNLSALSGAERWERQVTEYANPVTQGLTLLVVFAPLLLHTLWGLRQMVKGRPNNLRYPNFQNLKFLLQRLSAIGVLFFLGAHIYLAFLKPRVLEGHAETFANISAFMHHHKPTLAVYLLGTLGVAYHLANGVWTFCMYWGVAVGATAGRRLAALSVAFGVFLLAISWTVLFALYQAGAAFPPPP
jgi:succinate dehydrogenase / fumarate reductase, cytochrome b subunit